MSSADRSRSTVTVRTDGDGDLAADLRAAAADLIAQSGPSGFSMREVARRVGVSHAAPANHFDGAAGLLTATAADGYRILIESLSGACVGDGSIDDAEDLLNRAGATFVQFALMNPGYAALMFRSDLLSTSAPVIQHQQTELRRILGEVLARVRDELQLALDVESTATLMLATMHGLVCLLDTVHNADDCCDSEPISESVVMMLIESYSRLIAGTQRVTA